MKATYLLTILVLLAAQMSYAAPKPPPQQPIPHVQVSEPVYSREQLQAAFDQATGKLNQLEAMLAANEPGPTLQMAMEVLNAIKVKTGVNPVAQYSEKIEVSGILSAADLNKTFSQLNNHQQEDLARLVASHKGGLYIPLLNVAKRVRILYVKAFYEANKNDMLKRDAQKMLKDLMSIHNISILVRDNAAGGDDYMLFDLDVADSDYQYQFNKEIIGTALSYAKAIGTSEAEFENALVRDRSARLQEHWKGYQVRTEAVHSDGKNFDVCFKIYHISLPANVAATQCMVKSRTFRFANNPKFDKCLQLYNISLSANHAADQCIEISDDSSFN